MVINKGELKYFGDPSDMVEMANGKVWQFNIDKTEFEKVLDKSLVIHHIQEGDTIRVRYLSVGQPYEGAVEVEANLEERLSLSAEEYELKRKEGYDIQTIDTTVA